jgi:uncharacterized membrane protein YeaQ/YmgE (transglycosylase-associated protein family)
MGVDDHCSCVAGLRSVRRDCCKAADAGKDPGRLAGTTVIGLIGAVVGRYTGREIGLYGADDPIGFVMAIIGALMFLAIYRWFVS